MHYTSETVLRKVLADTGMTQAELAERMGYDLFHINRIINGHRAITGDFLWRFYELFARDDAPLFFDTAPAALDKLRQLTGQTA